MADDQARGREDDVVGPEHCCSEPSDAVDEVVFPGTAEDSSSDIPSARSKPAQEKQHDNDDQDDADDAKVPN